MATEAPPLAPQTPTTQTPALPADDSLGIDREFLLQMSRMPLLALIWVIAAVVAAKVWAAFSPTGLNAGPLVVVCFGMILAAFIDGWALKVPNWVTLPLILSGWLLGLMHDLGLSPDGGTGGILLAIGGTFLGFILLFPMLAIRGVGEGDVKMQMGFGAWVAAYFGSGATTQAVGLDPTGGLAVVFWAFVYGALAGGVFGMAMILIRRKWGDNARMLKEIGGDVKMIATGQGAQAIQRAEERRQRWVKLPYGIPLCVGFLMYLGYILILRA